MREQEQEEEEVAIKYSTISLTPGRRRKLSSLKQRKMDHQGRLSSTRWLLLVGACMSIIFCSSHSLLSRTSLVSASSLSETSSRRLLVKQHQHQTDASDDDLLNNHNQQHRQHHHHHNHNQHNQHNHQHQHPNTYQRYHHHLERYNNDEHKTITSNKSLALIESDYLGTKQQQFHLNYRKPSESPQVPEQLPIVVSSSDNSYVSASPVISETTQQPTTTMRSVVNDKPAINHEYRGNEPHLPLKNQHHNHHPSSPHSRRLLTNRIKNYDEDDNDVDVDFDHDDRGKSEGRKQRLWSSSLHKIPLIWSSWAPKKTTIGSSTSNQLDKISSTSDISTTATTTQRNIQTPVILSEEKVKPTKSESLISRFEIKLATIINTQESIDSGATFINYTIVTNFDACLVECWITDSCDTVVYQESTIALSSSPSSSSSKQKHHDYLHSMRGHSYSDIGLDLLDKNSIYHTCFLFECVKSNEFKCQFSAHNNYVSSILMKKINSVREMNSQLGHTINDRKQQDIRAPRDEDNNIVSIDDEDEQQEDYAGHDDANYNDDDCDPEFRFKCLLQDTNRAGCIGINQRCDGISQCLDGSDELDCLDSNPSFLNTISSSSKVVKSVASNHRTRTISDSHDDSIERTPSNPIHEYILIDQEGTENGESHKLEPVIDQEHGVHYSKIVKSHHGHPLNGLEHKRMWHDSHIASIRIGEYEDYGKGSLNSALIATLFGIAITAMLIMIVGHKMRSIRKRLAYKNRRRSLVPDKELYINTLQI